MINARLTYAWLAPAMRTFCEQLAPLHRRLQRMPYSVTLAVVAGGIGLVGGLIGAAAGLSLEAISGGTPEVVIAHMALLTALLWPSMAVLVRGLQRRTPGAWLGVALYPLALIAFMAAFFGKPFDLAVAGPMAKLLPGALAMLMGSWLIVEAARQRRDDAAH